MKEGFSNVGFSCGHHVFMAAVLSEAEENFSDVFEELGFRMNSSELVLAP
jgi:hypothetical protein